MERHSLHATEVVSPGRDRSRAVNSALGLAALALFGLGAAGGVQAQKPAAPVQPACPIWRELPQGDSQFAKPQWRVGPRKASASQSVTVALRLPNQPALEAFVRQLNDPNSPEYHHFLTPAQFTDRFSPSPADYAAVLAHLKASGLKIERTSANRLTVNASGTVGQVEAAFATSIAVYQDGNRAYYANETAPKLPPAVVPLVESVFGLDSVPLKRPTHRAAANAKKNLTAGQVHTAYNLDAFYNAGIRGKGKTIAVFSSFATTPGNIDRYINDFIRTMPSTPAGYVADITYQNVDGGPTDQPAGGNLEADLDLDMIVSTVPDATIRFYGGPDTGQGQFDTLAAIVSDDLADVASQSYVGAEASYLPSQLNSEHVEYLVANTFGMTFFCSSGDNGAAAQPGVLSVGYPASDPNNVAVGGTTLTLDGANHIASETGWSGSGGGISAQWSAPSWQMHLGISNPGNNRLVPDVALNADPNTGYVVYFGVYNTYPSAYYIVGGTSASCPMWAGATALMELYSDLFGVARRQGNINAILYPLLSSGVFHDITSGSNITAGTGSGYFCTAGYDLVTGLGSADFYALAGRLVTTVSGTVTLPDCVHSAQPVSFEFRYTDGSGSFTRMLTLSASGAFSLNNVPRGSYDLAIKGSKWLQKVVPVDVTSGPVASLTATLLPGDVNGDNQVDILDLGGLADAFNTSQGQAAFNANADLNCDGKVDITDLGLLADNFGKQGDP
jgi:kumamolisin